MSQRVEKRKQPKKPSEAQKLGEEKKLDEEFTYGQTEIGECLGVDRSTVARWCRQGLPYERTAHGQEHRIKLRTALHWNIGHKWATDKNIELSALEKILFALAWGAALSNENLLFSHWKRLAIRESDWLCASREELSHAVGFLYGADLLPWSRAR